MENGESVERKLSGLTLTVKDPSGGGGGVNGNDGLFQVMKAVEAAEATIRQQVEENNRLRSELQKKNDELEKYKFGDLKHQSPRSMDRWDDDVNVPHREDQVFVGLENHVGRLGNMTISPGNDVVNAFANGEDQIENDRGHAANGQSRSFFDSGSDNEPSKMIQGGHIEPESSQITQFPTPSTESFSPRRSMSAKNLDSQLSISEGGLIAMAEVNNPNNSNQDLVVKVREHEEEISQLKKHLAEYSVKEAQICQEKYALEKRISYMRLAFDQQQQDLVDAASKAITYRQDIMEENVRLTYALQAAQQERSAFVSSLMPLLAEYSLQPPVADAQSIVSNVKVLFRHLQEQLLITEGKLKESQYQLAPWRSDVNPSSYSQSPSYPVEVNDGLELVHQPTYSNEKMVSSDPQTTDGDLVGHPQSGLNKARNPLEHNELGNYTHLASREASAQLVSGQAESQSVRNTEETVSKKVTFGDLVRNREFDEPDGGGHYSDRDSSANWSSKSSTYATSSEDPNMAYPHLPPVLEEPSSSFSEAADDDPLPAIEGLQISGEAYPGRQLRACGYSINGTTSCNFEWIRHYEDGSFQYIDGAKQPNYQVNADDIDTYLAIEVQPLDDRKRKGDLVKVFANDHKKITCDEAMHNIIQNTFLTGHASYQLLIPKTGFLDMWEPAFLAIKRDGYSIKGSGPSPVSVSEKFSQSTKVSVSQGSPLEFAIIDSQGIEFVMKVDEKLKDISFPRETIVLTLRLFIRKATEKKKQKKRGLFFNK